MKKIILLGASLDTDNRGVSALSAAACKLFNIYFKNYQIVLIVGTSSKKKIRTVWTEGGIFNIQVLGYRKSFSGGITNSVLFALFCAVLTRIPPFIFFKKSLIKKIPILNQIKESSFVADIFAGDSFSDIYGLDKYFFNILTRLCVLLLKKDYVLLPQTYGPFYSIIAKKLSKKIIKHSKMIYTRTHNDTALRALRFRYRYKTKYCPDLAFILDPDYRRVKNFKLLNSDRIKVGINVSGLLFNSCNKNKFGLKMDYQIFLLNLIIYLVEFKRASIILVPHTYNVSYDNVENDYISCKKILDKVDTPYVKMIDKELNQHEIKGVIGSCDFFVGSRLHSCIAALSQEIITIGVAYSKKFIEVFTTMGMSNFVVDARKYTDEMAISKIMNIFPERESYLDILRGRLKENKERIYNTFCYLNNTL